MDSQTKAAKGGELLPHMTGGSGALIKIRRMETVNKSKAPFSLLPLGLETVLMDGRQILRAELEGSNRAHGMGFSANSVMGWARKLIEAGHPDQPFECYRGEMKCLIFKSLAWAARHTIQEEPSLYFVKYKKFSKALLKKSEHRHAADTSINLQLSLL